MIGTILHNRYRILSILGQGAMGVVYQAIDEQRSTLVAIKALHQHLSADSELVHRFFKEANALSHLHHPNIVEFVEAFEQDHRYYIVLAYVDGFTLSQLLATSGTFAPDRAAYVCMQVASALAYAHAREIIHRDIKSSNIMQTRANTIILTDFGIAREGGKATAFTSAGTIIGTAEYMSPEQAQGNPNLDRRSDIYSLGIVLYEMLVGRVPFQATDQLAVMYKQVHERPARPTTLNNRIPRELEQITLKALAKNPTERYAGATEFANALQLFLNKGRVTTPTPRPFTDPNAGRSQETMAAGALAGAGATSGTGAGTNVGTEKKRGMPVPLLVGGFATVGLLMLMFAFLFRPASPSSPTIPPPAPTGANPGGQSTNGGIATRVGFVPDTPTHGSASRGATQPIKTFTPRPLPSKTPFVQPTTAPEIPTAIPVFPTDTAPPAPTRTRVPPPAATRVAPTKTQISAGDFKNLSPIAIAGCSYGVEGDGWYHIRATNDTAPCAALYPLSVENFVLEATMKRIDGNGYGGGLGQIRFGATGDDRISLSITRTDPERNYGITGQSGGNVQNFRGYTFTESLSSPGGDGQVTDRIRLVVQNGVASLSINGNQIDSVPLASYRGGLVGLAGRSVGNNAHIAFSRVIFEPLP